MAKHADPFAEIDASQRKLVAQLAASPVQNVLGVVMPHYGFGFHDQTNNRSIYLFTLGGWRIEGGAVKSQELTIRRNNLTENALFKLKESLVPYSVVRIRARVIPVKFCGTWQARMEKFLGPHESDAVLNRLALEMKKPVICNDKFLGALTLNRALDLFEGEAGWRGNRVSVYLRAKNLSQCQKALGVAHSLWRAQATWDMKCRTFAARELLAVKNEQWLEDGESKMTVRQFKDKMRLTSVSVSTDGSFEFFYEDDDLFFDHAIAIRGRVPKGLTEALIEG